MSYEEMWNLLKRTVKNDYEFFYDNRSSYEFNRGAFDEAQDVLGRMDELEHIQGDE